MKNNIFFLLLISLFSCNKNEPFIEELTKENNCWVFIGDYPIKTSFDKKTYGGNRFLINGEIEDILVINGVEKSSFNFEISNSKTNK